MADDKSNVGQAQNTQAAEVAGMPMPEPRESERKPFEPRGLTEKVEDVLSTAALLA